MKSNEVVVPVLFILLGVLGCGGDSGSSATPTDPNQSFSLAALNSTTPGTIYATSLIASDSDGVSYSGTLSVANRAEELYEGVLTTPRDNLISLAGGSVSFTVTGTDYVGPDGYSIAEVYQTTGVTCLPDSLVSSPSSVKIGDFGILASVDCDDGTSQSRSWRVEDAGGGRVDLVTVNTERDSLNDIISVTDSIFTIDGDGDIVGYRFTSSQLALDYSLTGRST